MIRARRLGLWLAALTAAACATGPRAAVKIPLAPPKAPVAELVAALDSSDPAQRADAAWQLAGADSFSPATQARLESLADKEIDVFTPAQRAGRPVATLAMAEVKFRMLN
jgi:hypothetical protein